jgi:putative transposase
MMLTQKPKRYRYPAEIISHAIWMYHRFNISYRDIEEMLRYRGILVSYETVRTWSNKFGKSFADVIKKKEPKPTDKWHLDEMIIKMNGVKFILWRAVDSNGHELDVFLQKRKNKKAAIRFLTRLLGSYPSPRVIVTDRLQSYTRPIKHMTKADHRRHKGLNNRVENAHQPTRRKEKSLIKFKSPGGLQRTLTLMGRARNIFAVPIGRYLNSRETQKQKFNEAMNIWQEAAKEVYCF